MTKISLQAGVRTGLNINSLILVGFSITNRKKL